MVPDVQTTLEEMENPKERLQGELSQASTNYTREGISKRFVDETLWPEFQAFDETLRTYLSEVTERVVSQVIHQDNSEAEVVAEPPQLARAVDAGHAVPATSSAPLGQSDQDGAAASKNGGTRPPLNRSRRKKRKKRKRH